MFGVVWASLEAQMVKNLPATQETQIRSLGQEEWNPTIPTPHTWPLCPPL